MIRSALLIITLLFLSASSDEKENVTQESKPAEVSVKQNFHNDLTKYNNIGGVAGVFEQPAMLCLTRTDSAPMQKVAEKVSAAYELLEREMKRTGAQPDGPAGQISYNNDVKNFKFDCFFLIAGMPPRAPDSCKIVLLNPGPMLLYNHYGSYDKLYKAYDSIRNYCKSQDLLQNGPVREFYITDPSVETDRQRWLTRIMVPINVKN